MIVTLLHCPRSKHGPYHLVYDLERWPDGTLRNRGWRTAPVLYQRYGTLIDTQIAAGAYRYLCWRYRAWEHLLLDEAKCGVDAAACRALWRGERIAPDQVPVTADLAARAAAAA